MNQSLYIKMKFVILKSFKIEFVNQEIDASLRVNAAMGEELINYCFIVKYWGIAPLHPLTIFGILELRPPSAKNIE